MTSLPTVLVFTCSEYGQANVALATSYELALAGANVWIASFAPLATRVSRLQERISRHASRSPGNHTGSVFFHECKGITPYWDALEKRGLGDATLPHPPGVSGALECYSRVADIVVYPWSPEEHYMAMERVKETVATVRPTIVAIDPLFLPAIDGCKVSGQKFVLLMPNSIRDVALNLQPRAAALWKYPALCSGFAYPLKLWQIPLNIYLYIRRIIHAMTSVNIKRMQALRSPLGLTSRYGYEMYRGVPCICPALPETDFSLEIIPEQLVTCGPIIVPFDPLDESDPTLMKWLNNGPTVMINLGSHAVSDEKLAREMASAFRILLDYHNRKGNGGIQILWKARASGNIQNAINEVVGKEIEQGRVKVVVWLDADPVSILQHPNVVCTVHHGGANSYFEGIWSGVPHIVLPVWLDTYDYANRVEYLNIGIYGNKSCAPRVQAEELGQALVRVTGDGEEAAKFRATAKQLQEICRAKGSGRKLASMAILKEVSVAK